MLPSHLPLQAQCYERGTVALAWSRHGLAQPLRVVDAGPAPFVLIDA